MFSLKEALDVASHENITSLYNKKISIKFHDVKCMRKNSVILLTGYRKCQLQPDQQGSDIIVHDINKLIVYVLEVLNNKKRHCPALYDHDSGHSLSILQKYSKNKELLEKILLEGKTLRIRAYAKYQLAVYWKSYKYVNGSLYIKQEIRIKFHLAYAPKPDRLPEDVIRLELMELLATSVPTYSISVCKTYKLLCDLTNINVTDIIFDYYQSPPEAYKSRENLTWLYC